MKKQKPHGDPWSESYILSRPDGTIHAVPVVPESPPEKKRPGPEPTFGADEAWICLGCPLNWCFLDKYETCPRLEGRIKEMKSRKEGNDNDNG